MKNHYQTLGLKKNATPEEIKKAYKLYALKFHPDQQKGDEFFEEKFKEIKEAYEVLSDPLKRKQYDNTIADLGNSDKTNSSASTSTEKKPNPISFETSLIKVTNTHIRDKMRKIDYSLSDIQEAIIKKSFNPFHIFSGCAVSGLGIYLLSYHIFLGIGIIIVGIIGCFSKGKEGLMITKKGEKIKLPITYTEVDKIVKLINEIIRINNKYDSL